MSFEAGKTYISNQDGYVQIFRVDHIQAILGVPTYAVGVADPGDPDEFFEYWNLDSFDEYGWQEL